MSTTIELTITEDELRRLDDGARCIGVDRAQYVSGIVHSELAHESFDEILKPLRDEVEASGMSDEELDTLLAGAIGEARQARKR